MINRYRMGIFLLLTAVATALSPGWPALAAEPAADYLVGRGISDITGEAAEVGMMGYSSPTQQTSGIHQRERSRAFIIAEPDGQQRVAIANIDAGQVFQSVQQAVIRNLKSRYGELYSEKNVLISATHTHAGPGGYSHYAAYNLATLGFNAKTFQAIVDGITESIVKAHVDLKPGSISLGRGELTNASVQRSRGAFDRNPAADKAAFPLGIDPSNIVFGFQHGVDRIGAISWFPTHNTSMTNSNTLISGDNRGYAAYNWEHDHEGVRYLEPKPGFVASFMQTNTGDMSPNLNLKPGSGPTNDEYQNTQIIGQRQADKAREVAGNAGRISGGIDSRQMFVDMSAVNVSGAYTSDGAAHTTCAAAIGTSTLAGSTEDGPAIPVFTEGMRNPLFDALGGANVPVPPSLSACQAPKLVAVPLGLMKPYPWVPEVLPIQLLKVGQMYIAGGPAEFTIVAGLRIRRTIAASLGVPIENVIMAGYANAYSQYVTTPEEYETQQYEGASTLFGKWTLPAYQQQFATLAASMRDGTSLGTGPTPRDLSGKQLSFQTGVVFDDVPWGKKFGDVVTQPAASYARGQTASAVFWTGHPKNNLRRNATFLEVQRLVEGKWVRVADDGDWSTQYRWTRDGIAYSKATITWAIGADVPGGTYRIVHYGDWKNGWTGAISPLVGTSAPFAVT